MQYLLKSPDGQPTYSNSIIIEHGGEILIQSVKTYRALQINNNLITDINRYWSLLPIESQDSIFAIYKRIFKTIEETDNIRKLDEKLLADVAELFSYHQFDSLLKYYTTASRIKIPLDLKTEYTSERDVPELTYLKPEYHELIVLAIAMKVMLPIWGEYIPVIASDTANSLKDYRAAALLSNSDIIRCRPVERLYTYITTYCQGSPDKHSTAAITAGLDENQVPNWLLGHVLVRKIATAELHQNDVPGNPDTLISTIYNYIKHLTETLDKHFGGRINEKGNSAMDSGDDDNTSVAENYKIKQEISEGIVVTHEVHLTTKMEDILKTLDPTCPVEALHETIKLYQEHLEKRFKINQYSIVISQWVLHPVVTAKILEYVNYNAVISALQITYTLLRHWGYHSIAMLIFAKPVPSHDMMFVQQTPINDEQQEKLNVIYPHSPNVSTKRKVSKLNSNVAITAIKTLISQYRNKAWEIAPWEDLMQYPQLSFSNRETVTPYNIEHNLADMIIHLKTNIHPGLKSIVPLNTGV